MSGAAGKRKNANAFVNADASVGRREAAR